jgi:hypothetical protein
MKMRVKTLELSGCHLRLSSLSISTNSSSIRHPQSGEDGAETDVPTFCLTKPYHGKPQATKLV